MQEMPTDRTTARALPQDEAFAGWAAGTDAQTPSFAALATLRNTYRLLGMTLAFSGAVAATAATLKLPAPGLLLTLAGYFGLLFLTSYLRNSAWGLLSVFALTGFMGYTLGPLLSAYLSLANGGTLVALAAGTTAVAFFALSAYARSSQAIDMLRFGNFLMIGIITAFLLGLAAYFMALPLLALAVSGIFVLLMSGLIMYETQNIIRGGETNYIMATVTLFVAVYNLFVSLLQIFGVMGGDDG
jgi:modulator of FtsH protease